MTTNTDSRKIAFIVGSGAVENAWKPILNVIDKDSGYKTDADGANCYFARLVYLMRFYATGTFPGAKEKSLSLIRDFNRFKSEISKALITSEEEKQIFARRELKDILYKFVFSRVNKTVLITTNWDMVIDNAINVLGESNYPKSNSDIQSLHIHGSIKTPNGMYLPSEVVREPYRTKEDDIAMGSLHGTAWRALEEANITILYGLSVDPLEPKGNNHN
jgi:hypothetical protein